MADAPALEIRGLTVHYGHAPALQGVDLTLKEGALVVVGRNGMGKTTTCNAITGLIRASGGSVRVHGHEVLGLAPNRIARLGVGYVPQGRRIWPSLSVDEHLRLAARGGGAAEWTVERVYETFPQLKERRGHGGAQLSGGEQQMLAIGRALLGNPRLLVMDEPTEGLAPLIVDQLSTMLQRLARDSAFSVLLIEQNIGVATAVSDRVAIMMNGRIARELSAAELAADSALQQRLLGVGRGGEDEAEEADAGVPQSPAGAEPVRILTIRRRAGEDRQAAAEPAGSGPPPAYVAGSPPTRWSAGNPLAAARPLPLEAPAPGAGAAAGEPLRPAARPPVAELFGRRAYVAGTFDTKGRELTFLTQCLRRLGLDTVTVDLSTSGRPSAADVGPREVAMHHPRGVAAVFSSDRGEAVARMAEAFERFITNRRDVGGIVSAGGSGGTALATPAMRALPVGVPKVMVSTVASGDVKRYVGPSDIMMMYSVTDVQGINRISEQVLSNAAHALAGMIAHARGGKRDRQLRPAIGLTMFGVTTPCVQAVVKALEADYDCLVFHATGTGGQSMEKLADSHMLAGVIDVTTTEIADLLMGGVFSAGEDRLGAIIRTGIPYVGSCGALDMVNWGPMETVPVHYRDRRLHVHNPQVTLMRTTPEENERMGRWIAERLNRMEGPVRFLIPEGGVSLIDAPGQPFHDLEADRALFTALEREVRRSERRRLIRLPYNLNDPAFSEALVRSFREIAATEHTKALEAIGR